MGLNAPRPLLQTLHAAVRVEAYGTRTSPLSSPSLVAAEHSQGAEPFVCSLLRNESTTGARPSAGTSGCYVHTLVLACDLIDPETWRAL
ncbi:MAG: hypothetical protein ACK55I_48435 [bacterium]